MDNESYVFKTSCGTTGYFQKKEDTCRLYLEHDFLPVCKTFQWSKWEEFSIGSSAKHAPNTTLTDHISKGISYFVWNSNTDINPNIVVLETSIYPAGKYSKRMNRNSPELYRLTRREHSTIDEVRSFNNLNDSMNNIFNVVEPDIINEQVYGHKIRELLTIASTEVEYLLLQILKDNGYESTRFSTNDYVKVLPALKLNEYSVELKMHPSMGKFSPFGAWDASKPTESLSWYSAYNSAKHDRGGNFHCATLGATINAIAAVHILLEAQYGSKLFNKPMYSDYESCFQTINKPTWGCDEVFFPLIEENEKISWVSNVEYFK
jgi:hypothetical protein